MCPDRKNKSSPAAERRSSRLYFSIHYSLLIQALFWRQPRPLLKILSPGAHLLSYEMKMSSEPVQNEDADGDVFFLFPDITLCTCNTHSGQEISSHTLGKSVYCIQQRCHKYKCVGSVCALSCVSSISAAYVNSELHCYQHFCHLTASGENNDDFFFLPRSAYSRLNVLIVSSLSPIVQAELLLQTPSPYKRLGFKWRY